MSERQKLFCFNTSIFLIIICLIGSIDTSCTIRYPNDEISRPNLYKKVGSHKVKINNNFGTYYELLRGQEVEAQCDIEFNKPSQQHNKLFIKCENNDYIYTTLYDSSYYERSYSSELFLECSKLKWKLYESLHNFPWCSTNVTSYLLARPKHSNSTEYNNLAGICYDIYNFAFKSVYYTIAPGNIELAEPKTIADFYVPSYEIKYIKETFGENSLTESDFKNNNQFRNWIKVSNYQYNSMVLHSKLYSSFNDQFESLLDFVWWSNLRLYNWNNYQIALEAYVERENEIYDILAGISGAIKVPYLEDCQRNYSMKELYDNKNRKIPMYVWHYLQSKNDSTKDVVIIGFNSPFYEFYSESDIVFCADKCQEIPWLKQFSYNFRRSTTGIIFCCNVDDVKTSKRLSGFPESDMKAIPIKPEQKKPVLVKVPAVIVDNEEEEEEEEEQFDIY